MKYISEHYGKQKKMHKECKRMIRMISMVEEFKIDIGTKSRGKKLYQSSFCICICICTYFVEKWACLLYLNGIKETAPSYMR
jgi:hypothetical protein